MPSCFGWFALSDYFVLRILYFAATVDNTNKYRRYRYMQNFLTICVGVRRIVFAPLGIPLTCNVLPSKITQVLHNRNRLFCNSLTRSYKFWSRCYCPYYLCRWTCCTINLNKHTNIYCHKAMARYHGHFLKTNRTLCMHAIVIFLKRALLLNFFLYYYKGHFFNSLC